jgi:gluconate 2-dehydrogenase gamma chain
VTRVTDFHPRRTFLRAAVAAGASWATASLFDLEEALAFASQQAAAPAAPPSALTPAQAEVVSALTSRILPAVDGRPGAREAGALFFIDRALATFNAAQRPLYTEGIADLNRRAQMKVAGVASFAALTAAQQDEVIHDIEVTPFFQALRIDTIVGTFALPSWGGNRDYMGWHLLGFEHQLSFQAPFGYYDADVNRRN